VLHHIEKNVEEITIEKLNDLKMRFTEEEGYHIGDWSTALFEIFGIKLEGDAFSILKSVDTLDGFEVWRRLRQEAKPTTSVGTLRAIVDVVVCKRVDDIKNLMTKLTEWEVRVIAVNKDHGEETNVNKKVQLAVAVSMCPLSIQEALFSAAEKFTEYGTELKAKVRTLVANKIAMMDENTPMDINKLKNEGWQDDGWGNQSEPPQMIEWEGQLYEQPGVFNEYEVNFLNNGKVRER